MRSITRFANFGPFQPRMQIVARPLAEVADVLEARAGTRAPDGDPLDAMVLFDGPTATGADFASEASSAWGRRVPARATKPESDERDSESRSFI